MLVVSGFKNFHADTNAHSKYCYICFNLLPFAGMALNLLHYTFTGDVENDGKVIGGGRVEESEGWSGCNVGGEGGSGGSGGNVGGEGGSGGSGGNVGGEGGSGGNVGGEGGKEQRVVGEVLVVGVTGDIKNLIVSQVYLHFFFFIIYMFPPSKHFYYHCLQYTEQICFLPQTEMQKGGKIAPFCTSLSSCHSNISLYSFIATFPSYYCL